jgi:DNA-binding CsgD family transcriptional regulator
MLETMGVEAFAERARRELLATGENVRKRPVETRDELTAPEAQIARLAREGLSNPEIGTRLFISRRTVEYHLHKVFAKLDITSRNQLHRVLGSDPGTASQIDTQAVQDAWADSRARFPSHPGLGSWTRDLSDEMTAGARHSDRTDRACLSNHRED